MPFRVVLHPDIPPDPYYSFDMSAFAKIHGDREWGVGTREQQVPTTGTVNALQQGRLGK